MPSQSIILKPVSPFSFDLSARIFSEGDREIRSYQGGRFTQLICVDGTLIHLSLESRGTVDVPELRAELTSERRLSEAEEKTAAEIVNVLFNLHFDPEPFYKAVKRDPTMTHITRRLRGLRSLTTQTVFEALLDSIVEQQISLKVANSLERRLVKRFGETLTVCNEVFYAYPTAERLASASVEDLRACGLSQRKAEYIKEIATLVASGKLDLEKFKTYSSAEEVVKELDEVRGIGTWTAELTVLRSMRKWDAFPADDLGLRRLIAHYYCREKGVTSAEAREIAELWGKWKGLAAYYLVVAEIVGIEPECAVT